MAGFEPATYGLRNESNCLRLREPSRLVVSDEVRASEPSRTLADSRAKANDLASDYLAPILLALLHAQAAWIATHDPARLRRELIALLAALG